MNSKPRNKPLSQSSDLPVEPSDEQQGSFLSQSEQKYETRSNDGSKSQRWQQQEIAELIAPTGQGKQEETPPQPIMEALRRPELPRFGSQVALSEEVSLVEDGARTNQGANSQSSAKSNLMAEVLPNRSDFHLLQEMKEEEMSRPIFFNVIIVGASGLGKTSFIDAFLHRKFQDGPVIRQPTTLVTEHRGLRQEGRVNFEICMIDTPGYRHKQHTQYYRLLKKEITARFAKHHQEEIRLKSRNSILRGDGVNRDQRIHCCLYFTGGILTQQDCYLMKKLQDYVSIIPVLARGDCSTKAEILLYKTQIAEQKAKEGFQWFECEEVLRSHYPQKLPELLRGPFGTAPPFVLFSSANRIKFEGQKSIYGRQYSWGICNLQNPEHSDFLLLYNLLLVFFSSTLINLTAINQNEYLRRREKPEPEKHYGKVFGVCVVVAAALAAYGFTKSSS